MISNLLAGNCRGQLDDAGRPLNLEACSVTVARGSRRRHDGYESQELIAILAWVSGRGREPVSYVALSRLARERLAPHPNTFVRRFGSLKGAVAAMKRVHEGRRGLRSRTGNAVRPRGNSRHRGKG